MELRKIICTAQQLRSLRAISKLTQQQLAHHSGIGETSIQRYEHVGITKTEVLEKLLTVFERAQKSPDAFGIKPEPCPYEQFKPHKNIIPGLIAWAPAGCPWHDWHGVALARVPIANDIAWLSMCSVGSHLHWQGNFRDANGVVEVTEPRRRLTDWGIAETAQNQGAAWITDAEIRKRTNDNITKS